MSYEVFPLVWMAVVVPFLVIMSVLFWMRRDKAPVNQRNVPLVLLFDIFAVGYMLGLNFYYMFDDAPCWIGYINAWILLTGGVFSLVGRCWYLYFRYMVTRERLNAARALPTSVSMQDSDKGDRKSQSTGAAPPHLRMGTDVNIPIPEKASASEDYMVALDGGSYWYNEHRYMIRSQYIVIRIITLELLVLLAMLVVLIHTGKISADRSDHCVSDVTGLNESYYCVLGMMIVVVAWFAWALRDCTDGFGVKTELRASVIIALCGTIFYGVLGENYPYQPVDGNMVTVLLFCVSTVWPVYRTYVSPPEITMPDEVGSVAKLISFPEGFEAFKDHLTSEFSVENILFWQDVQQYLDFCVQIEVKKLGRGARYRAARAVFRKYIRKGGPLEVNISHEVSLPIRTKLDEADADKELSAIHDNIFDDAAREILSLMQADSYARFIRLGKWKTLEMPTKMVGV